MVKMGAHELESKLTSCDCCIEDFYFCFVVRREQSDTHFTSQVGHLSEASLCISLSGMIWRGSTKFTRARGT